MKLRKLLESDAGDELPAEKREPVVVECVDFLRAGGTLSLNDWDYLAPFGRACLAEASVRLQGERATLAASEHVRMVAEAMREARARSALSAAADSAAAAVPQERAP